MWHFIKKYTIVITAIHWANFTRGRIIVAIYFFRMNKFEPRFFRMNIFVLQPLVSKVCPFLLKISKIRLTNQPREFRTMQNRDLSKKRGKARGGAREGRAARGRDAGGAHEGRAGARGAHDTRATASRGSHGATVARDVRLRRAAALSVLDHPRDAASRTPRESATIIRNAPSTAPI